MTEKMPLHLDNDYLNFLDDIKNRLKTAQIRASLAVNKELIHFYWGIGKDLIEKQRQFKWGTHVLEQFSHDLRKAFPEMQGFSVTNLKRMRLFAKEYPDLVISPQLVDQLPWGHIAVLMHQVKSRNQREWYTKNAIQYGWSRSILEMQVESDLFSRQGIAETKLTNYHEHLPQPQSDLAREILKDPYHFDFLTISNEAHERDIENALIVHIKDFLIELGQGFAFVGSQVPLTFDDQEFFLDLLFWHLELRCFCVVELKSTKLKIGHTEQLGFYMSVVDDQLRKDGDNRTIGILLCKSKNKIVAEYALRNINAPIGISEYQLTKAVPEKLKTSLPSIQEIEAELNQTLQENNIGDLEEQ